MSGSTLRKQRASMVRGRIFKPTWLNDMGVDFPCQQAGQDQTSPHQQRFMPTLLRAPSLVPGASAFSNRKEVLKKLVRLDAVSHVVRLGRGVFGWIGVMLQEVVRTGAVCQAGGGGTPSRPRSPTAPMHANATLTPLRRAQMSAELTASGASLRTVAARYGVCEKTVRRWRDRALALGSPARLPDRSSAPRRQPTRTSEMVEDQILALRRARRTYAQIRVVLPGVSLATLSRVLRRHGLARLSALEPPRPAPVRYEYPAPGGLLHLDIKKLGKFTQPGVRATGERAHRNPGAGVESLHVAIDDHSRVAFACLHPDEKRPSVVDALRQALAFYAERGVAIERLLTDRGASYRSKVFAQTCRELGLKHLFTRPYRPQTNGKAERLIQTMTREWAYARSYDSSDQRASFLPSYLHDYNFHRPHSALGHQPPASRLPKTADNLLTYNR